MKKAEDGTGPLPDSVGCPKEMIIPARLLGIVNGVDGVDGVEVSTSVSSSSALSWPVLEEQK